ncbi:Uncharacterised protein [Salmonella enterica subsp. enterica]|nr:Uncharacterised protein [Salmonella enterica subsp. enterica] [Salmonella enterica subsp. enterica serovar Menston]
MKKTVIASMMDWRFVRQVRYLSCTRLPKNART